MLTDACVSMLWLWAHALTNASSTMLMHAQSIARSNGTERMRTPDQVRLYMSMGTVGGKNIGTRRHTHNMLPRSPQCNVEVDAASCHNFIEVAQALES